MQRVQHADCEMTGNRETFSRTNRDSGQTEFIGTRAVQSNNH